MIFQTSSIELMQYLLPISAKTRWRFWFLNVRLFYIMQPMLLIWFHKKIVRSNTSQNQLPRKHTKRPWFNSECQRLRSQYRRAKNHIRRVNDVESFQFLHDASKAYKKCLNKHFTDYKKDFIKKLRSLKKSDPKSYWSLLYKADGNNSGTIHKISLEVFAEHFKKLNTVPEEKVGVLPEVDPANVSGFNLELNAEITEQEVLHSLKNWNWTRHVPLI